MYNQIINPVDGKKVDINSSLGKKILKRHLRFFLNHLGNYSFQSGSGLTIDQIADKMDIVLNKDSDDNYIDLYDNETRKQAARDSVQSLIALLRKKENSKKEQLWKTLVLAFNQGLYLGVTWDKSDMIWIVKTLIPLLSKKENSKNITYWVTLALALDNGRDLGVNWEVSWFKEQEKKLLPEKNIARRAFSATLGSGSRKNINGYKLQETALKKVIDADPELKYLRTLDAHADLALLYQNHPSKLTDDLSKSLDHIEKVLKVDSIHFKAKIALLFYCVKMMATPERGAYEMGSGPIGIGVFDYPRHPSKDRFKHKLSATKYIIDAMLKHSDDVKLINDILKSDKTEAEKKTEIRNSDIGTGVYKVRHYNLIEDALAHVEEKTLHKDWVIRNVSDKFLEMLEKKAGKMKITWPKQSKEKKELTLRQIANKIDIHLDHRVEKYYDIKSIGEGFSKNKNIRQLSKNRIYGTSNDLTLI